MTTLDLIDSREKWITRGIQTMADLVAAGEHIVKLRALVVELHERDHGDKKYVGTIEGCDWCKRFADSK